jgi:hypothetical protein
VLDGTFRDKTGVLQAAKAGLRGSSEVVVAWLFCNLQRTGQFCFRAHRLRSRTLGLLGVGIFRVKMGRAKIKPPNMKRKVA